MKKCAVDKVKQFCTKTDNILIYICTIGKFVLQYFHKCVIGQTKSMPYFMYTNNLF